MSITGSSGPFRVVREEMVQLLDALRTRIYATLDASERQIEMRLANMLAVKEELEIERLRSVALQRRIRELEARLEQAGISP